MNAHEADWLTLALAVLNVVQTVALAYLASVKASERLDARDPAKRP